MESKRKKYKEPINTVDVLSYGKIPPQAVEIEELILGAMMLDRDALKHVDSLKFDMFYKEAHGRIFDAIKELKSKLMQVDICTVSEQLKTDGYLDYAGGPYYIATLTQRVASSANIETHIKILAEKYIKREIIKIGSLYANNAFDDSTDVFEILDSFQNEVSMLSNIDSINVGKIGSESNIDLNTKLQPYKIILGENSFSESGEREIIEMLTSGNLSMINGKSKSRKSFAIMALCNLIMSPNNKMIGYNSNFERGIVVFDTEQFKHHTKRFYERLARLVDTSNFTMKNLRAYNKEIRLKFIKNYIETERPALAFIDNIRDVISDFNDIGQSDEIITMLSNLMERTGTHICCTLHVNKSDNNARGHIGSELTQKAETVFMVETFESGITEIRGEYTRNKPFKNIQFKLENSVPVFLDVQEITEVKETKPPF